MTRISYTVDQAADTVGLSAESVRNAIAAEELPAKRIGKRILISHSSLVDWFDGLDDYEPPNGGR